MDNETRELLLSIYRDTRTIAVVGASSDPSKAANRIPRYLQEQGFDVRPVNPRGGELYGVPVAKSLTAVERPIDLVNVFRPSAQTPDIARTAVEIGAKVLWMQQGIENAQAREIAEAGGLTVIENLCIGHIYFYLGLGPDLDRER